MPATGARVRNAYATYLSDWDNPVKAGLILDILILLHGGIRKDLLLTDGHAFH
ncbi:hypothetical protein PORCRE_1722 [Porphyromonas crevioricanis JCM 15906]|uniref:Uncharacterized protein n=1 Tax=Porphyromonas crevioricanis JCM 15906 TaxID=1305617 RepID=T1CQ74_9PORP|nr:hypothetical protein PORCRE_1722 [Porphyromonas crevioricanis JCM 15906]